ncbi:cytochrome P450 2C21-like isoform X3 [Hyperolius riggenbachi]|uniref:cytochrome P450 2C21-like isoform X3 n=1 Tax=Hyperolius riggenbachi TaxID=752182 RepID=UPI0035A32A13
MDFLTTTTFLLITCVIFLIFNLTYTRKSQKKGRLPPGPIPLPMVGNILQLNFAEVFKSLQQLSEKYGPVYTLHMGMEPVVVLCSCDAVKEALVDNAEDFGARGHMSCGDSWLSKDAGVVGSNGERWKQMRRFSLMTLRNFGMGKRSIESRIQEEAQFLTEEFKKTKCHPVDPTFFFSKAVSNVICSVVFGKRFEYDNKEFLRLLGFLHEIFKGFSSCWGQMYNMFPKVVGKLPGPHNTLFKAIDDLQKIIGEKVKKHKETLNPSSPRDFIDCFLIKMEQEKGIPQSEFNMEGIVNTTFDLFGAGTETVSTTLRYGLLILLKHPDVEEHMHKEIDHAIGRNRAPCIEDRSHMPYTDAVIHEIQRFIDLIPLGIPHKVTRDVHFREFVIPKGTTVYPMLSAVLRDPKQFKHPEQFNPGHFLDGNGKFSRNDGYMPFSAGKRICLGEGLAKMELFLFLTTILQNFSLRSPVDPEELDLTPLLSGFGNFPRPYKMCFIPR